MNSDPGDEQLTDGPILGYGVLRLALGVNFFMHGAVRIFGDYSGFIQWVGSTFEETLLSGTIAEMYGAVIPWIELVIGSLLIVGGFTRVALVGSGLFMISLIFGMTLRQKWDTVAFQMIYVLSIYLLLHNYLYNKWSVDAFFLK